MYRRDGFASWLKVALFASVFVPLFFIDTLQERPLWNFLIFYEMLSLSDDPMEALLWK